MDVVDASGTEIDHAREVFVVDGICLEGEDSLHAGVGDAERRAGVMGPRLDEDIRIRQGEQVEEEVVEQRDGPLARGIGHGVAPRGQTEVRALQPEVGVPHSGQILGRHATDAH